MCLMGVWYKSRFGNGTAWGEWVMHYTFMSWFGLQYLGAIWSATQDDIKRVGGAPT